MSRGRGARDAADREGGTPTRGRWNVGVPGRFEWRDAPARRPTPTLGSSVLLVYHLTHLAPIFALPRGAPRTPARAPPPGRTPRRDEDATTGRGLAAVPSSASCVIANAIVPSLARGSVAGDGLRLLGSS